MQEHWEKTENKLSFKVTAQEPHLSNIFDGFTFCPSERIGGFHIGLSLYIYNPGQGLPFLELSFLTCKEGLDPH